MNGIDLRLYSQPGCVHWALRLINLITYVVSFFERYAQRIGSVLCMNLKLAYIIYMAFLYCLLKSATVNDKS